MTANEKISQRTVIRARVGLESVETVGEVIVGRTLRKTANFGYGRADSFRCGQKQILPPNRQPKGILLATNSTAEFATAPFPSPVHQWIRSWKLSLSLLRGYVVAILNDDLDATILLSAFGGII